MYFYDGRPQMQNAKCLTTFSNGKCLKFHLFSAKFFFWFHLKSEKLQGVVAIKKEKEKKKSPLSWD